MTLYVLDTELEIFQLSETQLVCKTSEEGMFFQIETSSPYSAAQLKAQALNYEGLSINVSFEHNQDGLVYFSIIGDESFYNMRALISSLRKDQHISICANEDIEHSKKLTGFEEFHFIPTTFPELSYDEIDISSTFLGNKFNAPLFVTGMTGGIKQGGAINKKIALACQKYGIPMGVGSQRIALEHPEYSDIFDVKKFAPDLFLIGNIGAAQLAKGLDEKSCQMAVDMIGADALAIHVNVLQEVIQVEGDRDFSNLFSKIEKVCKQLSVPVIIKEVGSGMDIVSAKKLVECGVSAIDVGGAGGTSWGFIEGLRTSDQKTRNLASQFRNWGIPTAYSLNALVCGGVDIPITATGGIRDGLTVAKSVSLGANMAGVGLPIFKAALKDDPNAVDAVLEEFIEAVKITAMLTGSQNLKQLKGKLIKGLPYSNL